MAQVLPVLVLLFLLEDRGLTFKEKDLHKALGRGLSEQSPRWMRRMTSALSRWYSAAVRVMRVLTFVILAFAEGMVLAALGGVADAQAAGITSLYACLVAAAMMALALSVRSLRDARSMTEWFVLLLVMALAAALFLLAAIKIDGVTGDY